VRVEKRRGMNEMVVLKQERGGIVEGLKTRRDSRTGWDRSRGEERDSAQDIHEDICPERKR
jgi:hypothetical protein